MEVGDAEAEACGGLEATAGGVHADGGWGEGVVGGKHQGAPVLTAGVGSILGAFEDVMPF